MNLTQGVTPSFPSCLAVTVFSCGPPASLPLNNSCTLNIYLYHAATRSTHRHLGTFTCLHAKPALQNTKVCTAESKGLWIISSGLCHLVWVFCHLTTFFPPLSFQGHRWEDYIAEAVGRLRTRTRRTHLLEAIRDEACGSQHQGHLHGRPSDPGADGRALDVGQEVSAAVALLGQALDVQSILFVIMLVTQ